MTQTTGSPRRIPTLMFAITLSTAALAAIVALVSLGTRPTAGSGNTIAVPNVATFWTSLALDASGRPVVSYYDPAGKSLNVLRCGNPVCTAGNTLAVADSAGPDVGASPSLAIDASGKAVIAYTGSGQELYVLHCANTSCASANNAITAPDPLGGGGFSSSLALDNSGNPVVSYVGGSELRVLHCGDSNCSSGNSVWPIDPTGNLIGSPSLKLDASGYPVVSYYDSTTKDLKVAHCGDANCLSSTIVSPDTAGDVGIRSSLALDTLGRPIVSYIDATNSRLKVLHCGDVLCGANNTFASPDTARLDPISMTVDASGYPVVAYQKPNLEFRVLHCGSVDCTTGNVISAPKGTAYSGLYSSVALDSSGYPVVSYRDSLNGLEVLHCGDANCGAAAKPTVTPTITPTPLPTPPPCSPCPLDFSIGVDVSNDGIDDCNTRTGPTTCALPAGDSFRVRISVDILSPGLTYTGWEAKLSWSADLAYLTGTVRGVWPDQPWSTESLSGQTVTYGTFTNASSTYTGMLVYGRMFCVQGQVNTISLVHSNTDVIDPGVVSHYESPNPGDTLTVSCPRTSYSQAMTVGSGGTLQTDFGDTLSVPAAALASDTKITLGIAAATAPAPAGLVALPRAHTFSPSGLEFGTPASAVFFYGDMDLGAADPQSLRVYELNSQGNAWTLLGGTVDTGAQTVAVQLNHFSTYALFRDGSVDTDGDGCPDYKELGPDQMLGGQRDWLNPWDFFNPLKTAPIGGQTIADILKVVQQFNKNDNDGNPGLPPYAPGYTPDTDRTYVGPNVWNLGPPDGQQGIVDVLAAVKQYNHNCAP